MTGCKSGAFSLIKILSLSICRFTLKSSRKVFYMLYSYDKVASLITWKFLTSIAYLKKVFPLFCTTQIHFTCCQVQSIFFLIKLTKYFSPCKCEKCLKHSFKGDLTSYKTLPPLPWLSFFEFSLPSTVPWIASFLFLSDRSAPLFVLLFICFPLTV